MIVTAFKDPQMTATQIAETYGVSDTHAITTFSRYVDMPARQLTEAICIDEVYIDPDLKHLRDLKEKYIRFNKQYGGKYKEAKEKLKDIIAEYDNCPYDMFHTIADSLRYHFDAIANSFIMVERHCHGDTYIKRLSNGPAEALNRIVKDMKHNGRGYKNFDHLRNRFLYSQRANAAILGTPKPLEEVLFKTGISRGPYSKKSR